MAYNISKNSTSTSVKYANVFEIERYATKDGPGIRTVVFFKGCNLKCIWCQNPESQLMKPEVMYSKEQCAGCRKCIFACPNGSVEEIPPLGFISNHNTCILCGACVDACFYDARRIVGKKYTIESIMEEILKDKAFYDNSGGGVTFSGGEPLLQHRAVLELASRCKSKGIHTALETAGHVDWTVFNEIIPNMDLIFYDVKHIDEKLHKEYTGVSNRLILQNLQKLSMHFDNIVVRIPIIPKVNNTLDVQRKIYHFLLESTRVKTVELLPFHRLGAAKYSGLGRVYKMGTAKNLHKEDCRPFAEEASRLGLNVRIGAV